MLHATDTPFLSKLFWRENKVPKSQRNLILLVLRLWVKILLSTLNTRIETKDPM
jgi:hypothetical protein